MRFPPKKVAVANVRLTQSAFWKLLAFVGIVLVPLAAIGLANYPRFEGTHKVSACASCHVMLPMVNDMKNAASNTLAAAISKTIGSPEPMLRVPLRLWLEQLGGEDGRLPPSGALYNAYLPEPIKIRGHFNNENCLKCHQGMPLFEAVKSHQSVQCCWITVR